MPTFRIMYEKRLLALGGMRPTACPCTNNAELGRGEVGLGKRMHLSGDGAHRKTEVAGEDDRVRAVRIEVQVVGAVRVRRVLRGRPDATERAGTEEVGAAADARCRQEYAATVGLTGEFATFYTVHRCPFVSAVVFQFKYLNY